VKDRGVDFSKYWGLKKPARLNGENSIRVTVKKPHIEGIGSISQSKPSPLKRIRCGNLKW